MVFYDAVVAEELRDIALKLAVAAQERNLDTTKLDAMAVDPVRAAAIGDGDIANMTVKKMKIMCEPTAQNRATEPEPFVLTGLQTGILTKLNGKAMKARALAKALDINQPKLYEPKGMKGKLKELMQLGKVKKHSRMGYYRPDAPPPELGGDIKVVSTRG